MSDAPDSTFTAGETKLLISIIKNLTGDLQVRLLSFLYASDLPAFPFHIAAFDFVLFSNAFVLFLLFTSFRRVAHSLFGAAHMAIRRLLPFSVHPLDHITPPYHSTISHSISSPLPFFHPLLFHSHVFPSHMLTSLSPSQSNWDTVATEMGYKDAGIARTRWNQVRRKKIIGPAAAASSSSTTAKTKTAGGAKKGAAAKKSKKNVSESEDEDEGKSKIKVKAETKDEDEGKSKIKVKAETKDEEESEEETKPLPKKRGRPAKKAVAVKTASENEDDEKVADDKATNDNAADDNNDDEDAEAEEKPAPKKRGRPAKKAVTGKKTGGKATVAAKKRAAAAPGSDDEDDEPAPLTKKVKTEVVEEDEAVLGAEDKEDGIVKTEVDADAEVDESEV
jgi:hypothetical protein